MSFGQVNGKSDRSFGISFNHGNILEVLLAEFSEIKKYAKMSTEGITKSS